MYEKFTDRSRRVMQLANKSAFERGHEYVGTEHILTGLAKEFPGVGAAALRDLGISLDVVLEHVEKLAPAGPPLTTSGRLPLTPRTNELLKLAIEEAQVLGHNYVGTEHLLLGLLRQKETIAIRVLERCLVKPEDVRQVVLTFIGKAAGEKAWTGARKIHELIKVHMEMTGLFLRSVRILEEINNAFEGTFASTKTTNSPADQTKPETATGTDNEGKSCGEKSS